MAWWFVVAAERLMDRSTRAYMRVPTQVRLCEQCQEMKVSASENALRG